MTDRKARGTLALAALLAAGLVVSCSGHFTPRPQPPLADLNAQSLDAFRESFNSASDQVRIILLLSPT